MRCGDVCVIVDFKYKLYLNELCTLEYTCGTNNRKNWAVKVRKTGERYILKEKQLRKITYFNMVINKAQVNINDTPVIVGNK